MNDIVRVIIISDLNENKLLLAELLGRKLKHVTVAESLVDGLGALRDNKFDAVVLSYDIEDFYSIEDVVKILLESDSIRRIFLISENTVPTPAAVDERLHSFRLLNAAETADTLLRHIEQIQQELFDELPAFGPGGDNDPEHRLGGATLFDNIPVGLFRILPDGGFVECNQTMTALFRAPNLEVLLGESFFSLFADQEEMQNWIDIIHKDGMIRGLVFEAQQYEGETIWVRNNAKAVYDTEGKLQYFDGVLEDVTFQKRLEDKLSFLSTHDILTGLPNRNFFVLQAKLTLSQARYSGDMVAFLIIDIDTFSGINTAYGRKFGDFILQTTAERGKALLRKSDLIARLGEDRFIVLLPSVKSRRDILAVATKISRIFAEPVMNEKQSINISVSVGIAIFPNHGETPASLISRAEVAVKTVKEREKGGYMIYSEAIHSTSQHLRDS